jgi:hypothetical protein
MRILTGVLAAAVILVGGCADLDVTNPNEPDRERVLATPQDVQSLISSAYQIYFNHVQQTNPALPNAGMADNITGGFTDFGMMNMTMEPREAFNPSPLNTLGFVGRSPWDRLYPALSNVNDGLYAIDQGLKITTGPGGADETARAVAFGKFVQGIILGYFALYYDQAIIALEDTDLEQMDPTAFTPYPEVQAEALRLLDEAIAMAQSNTFTIPGSVDWINGITLNTADFIRLINTYKARIIAYMPRTWDERMAVDWNQVLTLIDAGITQDFAPQGFWTVWEGNYRRLLARVRTLRSDHVRPDMRALGPADVSGKFQTWVATPSAQKMPFQMETPDRRIQGPGGVGTEGKYFGYAANNIWAQARGTYRWSHYYWHREGLGDSWHTAPQVVISMTEMNLLKAEALIRLNRANEAIPLINLTRVANGELPPVTIDGPPDGPNCVPKKHNGACGSLWDALIHERQLENMGREGSIMWFDFRGLNRLQEGTLLHFPVSGTERENLGLPLYTFGGVGGDGAAPPPQYGRCPAALPRC